MIAVSTRWNAERHVGWAPAVRELMDLGFPSIALDGPAVQGDAAAAGRAIRERKGAVVALFAAAPQRDLASPTGGSGLVSPVAERRAQAVAAALAAGRAASAAGTGLVVLRVGEIPVVDAGREQRWTDRLAREGSSPELRAEVAAAAAELRPDRTRFVEMLCRSLWEIARSAPEVTWAVETPASIAGLPFPAEAEAMLSDVGSRRVALWHDVAHGARLAALGVLPQDAWLAANGGRTAGITISDWAPVCGHDGGGGRTPPGAGLADWTGVRAQIGAKMTRVLSLDPIYPAALLLEAARVAG